MFWWRFNQHEFLRSTRDLENRISTEIVRNRVVPTIAQCLRNETSDEFVAACLMTLAKIGDAPGAGTPSPIEEILCAHLSSGAQAVAEAAVIALGVLGHECSVDLLASIAKDERAGRDRVVGRYVPVRTRAFAAYALGLIGSASPNENCRRTVIRHLREILEADDRSSRDLAVATLIAFGLVPLQTVGIAHFGGTSLAPESSRAAQIDYLLRIFADDRYSHLVRAHAPVAMARLAQGLEGGPGEVWNRRVTDALASALTAPAYREVLQGCVLALGILGDDDDDPRDAYIRDLLCEAYHSAEDEPTRCFALIASAQVAARRGLGVPVGILEVSSLLTNAIADDEVFRPWAALSIGILGRGAAEVPGFASVRRELTETVRATMRKNRDYERSCAYALAVGLLRDSASSPALIRYLESTYFAETRPYAAVGLALMGNASSAEPIRRAMQKAKYRPEMQRCSALSLGLLGDERVVETAVVMLADAKGLATRVAAALALGATGDPRAVAPLLGMLTDDTLLATVRAFAVTALGTLTERNSGPWNASIARSLNYWASPRTLIGGRPPGILDYP